MEVAGERRSALLPDHQNPDAAGWARHFALITIGEDITEWRQAQQRLTETRKLAAVGQLAAASCTRSNNPLPRSWPAASPRTPHRDLPPR